MNSGFVASVTSTYNKATSLFYTIVLPFCLFKIEDTERTFEALNPVYLNPFINGKNMFFLHATA